VRLSWVIVPTRGVAILMCVTGRLVEPMSWGLIGVVWAYNLGWMGVMGGLSGALATPRASTS